MAMGNRKLLFLLLLGFMTFNLFLQVAFGAQPKSPFGGQFELPPDLITTWIPAMFMFLAVFVVLLIVSKLVPFIPQDKIGWLERILFSVIFAAATVFYAYGFERNRDTVRLWNDIFAGLGAGIGWIIMILAFFVILAVVLTLAKWSYGKIPPGAKQWVAARVGRQPGPQAATEIGLLEAEKAALGAIRTEALQEVTETTEASTAMSRLGKILREAVVLTNGQPAMKDTANKLLRQATRTLQPIMNYENGMRAQLTLIKETTSRLGAEEESEVLKMQSARQLSVQLRTSLDAFYRTVPAASNAPIEERKLQSIVATMVNAFSKRRELLSNLRTYETELGQFLQRFASEINSLHTALMGGLDQLGTANTHFNNIRNIINRQKEIATAITSIEGNTLALINKGLEFARIYDMDIREVYNYLYAIQQRSAGPPPVALQQVAPTPAGGAPSA